MDCHLNYAKHGTVFKKEAVDFLCDKPTGRWFADLTFGGGGHSLEILSRNHSFKVVAMDQDPQACQNAQEVIRERSLQERLFVEKGNFKDFAGMVAQKYPAVEGFQGIVADLGVSAHQLEDPQRGFSFRLDGPLDMRMALDDGDAPSASELVNDSAEDRLEEILRDYGEERFARRIARNIVAARSKAKIVGTKALEDIVFRSYPAKLRYGRIHPATRTFQALRIVLNDELGALGSMIPQAFSQLKMSGKLAIISFHSLEDRIVKNGFRKLAKEGKAAILTKKPVCPSEKEKGENFRARSAKLRVLARE